MSKSYDIDHEAEHKAECFDELVSALRAIEARIIGDFDAPELLAFGSLGDSRDDCLLIARNAVKKVKGEYPHESQNADM